MIEVDAHPLAIDVAVDQLSPHFFTKRTSASMQEGVSRIAWAMAGVTKRLSSIDGDSPSGRTVYPW